MKHICRTCKQEVDRIHDGYTICGKNIKIYKDLNGSRWNGNRCPQCHLKNLSKRHQIKQYAKRMNRV